VKFQLFTDKPPNIPIEYRSFYDLMEYGNKVGIEVFASVFDLDAISAAAKLGSKSIKLAYSERNNTVLIDSIQVLNFTNFYVSGDLMTTFPDNAIRLYCIPQYPVPFDVDFDDLFTSGKFAGFSDHTMGISQSKSAIDWGAQIIEKHYQIADRKGDTPDGRFAIVPKQVEKLCRYAHETRITKNQMGHL
jgi:sialic acid synthase SpsE